MAEDDDKRQDLAVQEADGPAVSPAVRLMLGALALPVGGVIAAAVLLLVGISLALVGLVLLASMLAGAVSVPLAALAGRRRTNQALRRPTRVLDAEATVRTVERTGKEGPEETDAD